MEKRELAKIIAEYFPEASVSCWLSRWLAATPDHVAVNPVDPPCGTVDEMRVCKRLNAASIRRILASLCAWKVGNQAVALFRPRPQATKSRVLWRA